MNKRQPGVIKSISYDEDHCSVYVTIDFVGSVQGFGGITLTPELREEFIRDICCTFRVTSVDKLVGLKCHALRCWNHYDNIEGLESSYGTRFTLFNWLCKHHLSDKTPLESRRKRLVDEHALHLRRAAEVLVELARLDSDYTDWG